MEKVKCNSINKKNGLEQSKKEISSTLPSPLRLTVARAYRPAGVATT